jgi:hypothetical protein
MAFIDVEQSSICKRLDKPELLKKLVRAIRREKSYIAKDAGSYDLRDILRFVNRNMTMNSGC